MNDPARIKSKLVLGIISILLLSQIFGAILMTSSIKKIYVESLIETYSVVGEDFKRNIENGLRFGKSIKKLFGVQKIITEIIADNPELTNVTVSLANGKILYWGGDKLSPKLPFEERWLDKKVVAAVTAAGDSEKILPVLENDQYHLVIPIQTRFGEIDAIGDISFSEKLIDQQVESIIVDSAKLLLLFTILTAVCVYCGLHYFVNYSVSLNCLKRHIFTIVFLILAVVQTTYVLLNVNHFEERYLNIVHNKTVKIVELLKDDIEQLLDKGILIDRLFKVDRLLTELVDKTDEIGSIAIRDLRRNALFQSRASEDGVLPYQGSPDESFENLIVVPLHCKGAAAGFIEVGLSRSYLAKTIREIVLDVITVAVISLLCITELMILLFLLVRKQLETSVPQPSDNRYQHISRADEESFAFIRPVGFMYLFTVSLSVSFIPLYMAGLSDPIKGLPSEVILGIPISVEMLFASLGILLSGGYSDRRGWQYPFYAGLITTAVGAFFSGLAESQSVFVLCRGIVGLGYGLTWMAFNGYILRTTKPETKALALSTLSAGIFSGMLCGGAAGGLLAERFGFANVFYFAALLIIPSLILGSVLLKEAYQKKSENIYLIKTQNSFSNLLKYLFDRHVLGLVFLSSIPAAICFVGILHYAVPIYLDQMGLSQSNIARLLMVYALFMIYLAPIFNKWVDRAPNKKLYIAMGGMVGAMGLISFSFFDGIIAVVVTVVMLAVSSSLGLTAQTVYAVEGVAAEKIGTMKAMGIYRFLQRLGQVLGPIVFGTMIAIFGLAKGMTFTGVIYLVLTVMFILVGGNRR